ncbi:Uu.00g016310.m01.CDS01 [Anthostomella pinea]|uniref:Uu.00g016310.m01.CDS01 n=1 Tax=Anthostomella pinea TaxID=933095 RepID=A0AAI8VYQ2_9PEZI|nr:Uu.00g016310.m01.CDS01 [Anthostomella pinea]
MMLDMMLDMILDMKPDNLETSLSQQAMNYYLQMARRRLYQAAIKSLLKAGASATLKDTHGRMALSLVAQTAQGGQYTKTRPRNE